jgi:hypothetical protein
MYKKRRTLNRKEKTEMDGRKLLQERKVKNWIKLEYIKNKKEE